MTAHIEINLNSPQAASLLQYIETLPFAKVNKDTGDGSQTSVQQLLDSGKAVTLEEYGTRLREAIKKGYGTNA